MILNKPFYALIDQKGEHIMWDYESPLLGDTRSDVLATLRRCTRMAKESTTGTWMGHDVSWWKACTVRKVVVTQVLPGRKVKRCSFQSAR